MIKVVSSINESVAFTLDIELLIRTRIRVLNFNTSIILMQTSDNILRRQSKGTKTQEVADDFDSKVDDFYAHASVITTRHLQHNPYGKEVITNHINFKVDSFPQTHLSPYSTRMQQPAHTNLHHKPMKYPQRTTRTAKKVVFFPGESQPHTYAADHGDILGGKLKIIKIELTTMIFYSFKR